MSVATISVVLGVLAVLGQAANIYLHLRIQNCILRSEKETREWVEVKLAEYVRDEVCEVRHGQRAG